MTITSAVELDEQTVKQIGDQIAEQTGRKVELSADVDPDVLGGLVVRVGNTVLDASRAPAPRNPSQRSRPRAASRRPT